MFDWVAHPIQTLIKDIYRHEMKNMRKNPETLPCHMRIELVASLERLLCYCHTGNTAVLATSLMHPLGLSRGVLKDGYPMLLPLFTHPTIRQAKEHGFLIDARKWPVKGMYPAIASKKAQVLTYSMTHFLVSIMQTLHMTTVHRV